jgi:hypothetical protein
VVLDSDDAWAVARQIREEEPWLRCEGGGGGKGKTKVYRPKKVVRTKVSRLVHVWMEVFMLGSVETQERSKKFLEKVGRLDNELLMHVESEVARAIPLDVKEWDDAWAPEKRREGFKRIIRNEWTKRSCTHYFTHGLMALIEGGSVNEVSIAQGKLKSGTFFCNDALIVQKSFNKRALNNAADDTEDHEVFWGDYDNMKDIDEKLMVTKELMV